MPHLGALAILLVGYEHAQDHPRQASQLTGPAQAAELIDRLRSTGCTLTYDPRLRILRTDTEDSFAVTIGRSH